MLLILFCFFFFNDTATTEIYTLSLHDALPICSLSNNAGGQISVAAGRTLALVSSTIIYNAGSTLSVPATLDRKSTRLNSSHGYISYAVFCLKKKKKNIT